MNRLLVIEFDFCFQLTCTIASMDLNLALEFCELLFLEVLDSLNLHELPNYPIRTTAKFATNIFKNCQFDLQFFFTTKPASPAYTWVMHGEVNNG